jgi:hypothetical protein
VPQFSIREKLERDRAHAQAALDAYRRAHADGLDPAPDEVTAITDLIVDLLHLADANARSGDARAILEQADEHFEYERDPRNAAEDA